MLFIGAVAMLVVAAGTFSLWSPRGSGTVDEVGLREALSRKLRLDKDTLKLDIGPPVPGMLVFHAYDPRTPQQGVTGVFDGELHLEFEASSQLVLRALGYGERDADPLVVAGAVGKLEGNPGTPFLTQFAIDQSGNPAVMTLPRVVDVDGQQVVEYWNMTSRRPPWRSRVLRGGDGTFEVSQDLPPGGR
jgi:hypothetical protein